MGAATKVRMLTFRAPSMARSPPNPSVTPLVGFTLDPPQFAVKHHPTTLESHLSALSWPAPQGLVLMTQAAIGLAVLHSRGLAHRNLSLDSILVDGTPVAKVSNFATAVFRPDLDASFRLMPPEFFDEAPLTRESDVWTFGMLCFTVVSGGEEPFGNLGSNIAVRLSSQPGRPTKRVGF